MESTISPNRGNWSIDSTPPSEIDLNERPRLRRLAIVFAAMFVAQAAGSLFNISYNLVHLPPLLTEAQNRSLEHCIGLFNATAYPVLVAAWAWVVFRLRRPIRNGADLDRARRRVIHLPLLAIVIAALGWLLSLPCLLVGLHRAGEPLDPRILFHLPVSVGLAMVIALTIGYFLIDSLCQRLLFPTLFVDSSPARLKGAFHLSLPHRSRLAMLSAGVCPVLALLLLLLSPAKAEQDTIFAVVVAAVGIFSSVLASTLHGRHVNRPVRELTSAAQRVGGGDLSVRVDDLHTDEFGILAEEFNGMVDGLRERQRILSTFGRHVGEEVARELLRDEQDLRGIQRELSVLFADIRGFTTRCETLAPGRAVELLNFYHEHMTEVIESHGGIVNQLVGDGTMALFGATNREGMGETRGANGAIAAGREMVGSLAQLNDRLARHGFEPLRIGVGIHTGPAVVGTIGSPQRQQYTAIGDTVNTAARIEGMTKDTGHALLVSEATRDAADPRPEGLRLPPREVRGRSREIVLYALSI